MIFSSILYEAPDDEGDVGEDTAENETDSGEEGNTPDETPEDNEEDFGSEDFDASDGEESSDDFDGDSEEGESGDGDPDGGGSENELKSQERELFADLTDEQLKIRDKKLISLYIEMYDKIQNILSKSDRFEKTEKNIKVIDFSIEKLHEMKDILYDYIHKVYKTKTYIQNLTAYYEFVATLNGIDNILKKIKTTD